MNNELITCRICLVEEKISKKFISPCNCKGSIKYVHSSCFEMYIEMKYHFKCPICNTNYKEIEIDDLWFCNYYPIIPFSVMVLTSIYLIIIDAVYN